MWLVFFLTLVLFIFIRLFNDFEDLGFYHYHEPNGHFKAGSFVLVGLRISTPYKFTFTRTYYFFFFNVPCHFLNVRTFFVITDNL